MRNLHQAINLAHIEMEFQGIIIEMKGDHILATTLTPHPLLVQLDPFITCSLNLET